MIIINESRDISEVAPFYDKWLKRKMGGRYVGLCDMASVLFAEIMNNFARVVYIQQWDVNMETHTSCICDGFVYDFTIYQYKSTIPIATTYKHPLKTYEKHFTKDPHGMNGYYSSGSKFRKDWLFTIGGEKFVMKDKEEFLKLFYKSG